MMIRMTSSFIKFVLVTLTLFCLSVAGQWVNAFDREALLDCGDNQVISGIRSYHDNHFEDRRWGVRCRSATFPITSCSWTEYLNDWDQELLYHCPQNAVLSGLQSFHNNHYEDRRFMAKCCVWSKNNAGNCEFTDYINNWDQAMNFLVPPGRYIRGIYSIHNNYYEDRRWKIFLCDE